MVKFDGLTHYWTVQINSQADQLRREIEHREELCRRLEMRIKNADRRAREKRDEIVDERQRAIIYFPARGSNGASQMVQSTISSTVTTTFVNPYNGEVCLYNFHSKCKISV